MRQIGSFKQFEIAKRAGGILVGLSRALHEDVYLALDRQRSRLVELHFPGEPVDQDHEAVLPALVLRHAEGVDPILESGVEQGLPYYVTALKDGELLDRYVERRGSLIAPTAFSLVRQLLDELLELANQPDGLMGVSAERILISLEDESVLRLRILDYGRWSRSGEAAPDVEAPLVRQAALALYRLLTGPAKAGVNPDRVPMLNTLPGRLRNSLKACMVPAADAAGTLAELRSQVQEAFLAQSRDLHGKDSRRHMVALENMVPHSALRDLLFPDPSNMQMLARRYQLEDVGGERHPFSLPVTESAGRRKLTVQLLPGSGCMSGVGATSIPVAVGSLTPERHPNLLRCLGVWESPELAFLMEERGQEVSLTHVLRERNALKPVEARLILTQVHAALLQAQEAGIPGMDLRPGNMLLRVTARVTDREVEKLVRRHLDAWPPFLVVLRGHQSLRSLMEPPVLELPPSEMPENIQNRNFAALMVALLSGQRKLPNVLLLPESFSPGLEALVRKTHEALMSGEPVSSPADLVQQVQELIPLSLPELDDEDEREVTGNRLSLKERLRAIPSDEPMESMGSVSDFDEDQTWAEGSSGDLLTSQDARNRLLDMPVDTSRKPLIVPGRKSFLGGLWSLLWLVGLVAATG